MGYLDFVAPAQGALFDRVVHGAGKRFPAAGATGCVAEEHCHRVFADGFILKTAIAARVQRAVVCVGQLRAVREVRPSAFDLGPESVLFQFQIHDPVFFEIGESLTDDGIPGDGMKLLCIV